MSQSPFLEPAATALRFSIRSPEPREEELQARAALSQNQHSRVRVKTASTSTKMSRLRCRCNSLRKCISWNISNHPIPDNITHIWCKNLEAFSSSCGACIQFISHATVTHNVRSWVVDKIDIAGFTKSFNFSGPANVALTSLEKET